MSNLDTTIGCPANKLIWENSSSINDTRLSRQLEQMKNFKDALTCLQLARQAVDTTFNNEITGDRQWNLN